MASIPEKGASGFECTPYDLLIYLKLVSHLIRFAFRKTRYKVLCTILLVSSRIMVLLSALIVLSGFGIVGIHFSYALSVAKDVGTNADSHTGFEISGVDSPADTFLASSFPYDSISATSGADQTFTQEEVSTGSDASLDPPDVQSPELSSQDTASGSSTTEYMKPGLVITSKHCSLLSGRSQWAKRAQKGVCECMSPSEVCPSEQRTPVCCYGNFRNPNYIDTCIQCKLSVFCFIFFQTR